ncbi:MAG: FAD-dependent oxidoreductase, partial [Candidatus Mariimomonas ferrooxydans]
MVEVVWRVRVHMGTCGLAAGARNIMAALMDEIERNKVQDVVVTTSGCAGLCAREPMVTVEVLDKPPVKYVDLTEEKIREIFREHVLNGNPVKKYALSDIPFFKYQMLRVLRNKGLIDPEKIEDYIARDGYMAVAKALTEITPEEIIKTVRDSGLRGRGGAGFPTGLKWEFASKSPADRKFMLCNGDEGDPGAFMDRSVMEADPHSVIEGMIIGARAIGASEGVIYVRAEYPLAVERLRIAIARAYDSGLLGKNIFDSGFDFDLSIYLGAGVFVCGEETALMRSIEGKRGMPIPRPPFPAQKGLWEKPSVLNNVETLAQISPIILNGAEWYRSLGTEKSPGTKVFALTGAIHNVGLVEIPMGIPLSTIINDIGGGVTTGKFKAVQLGGPSGGCIPQSLIHTSVTYEDIMATGAIVGSGGMVVLDDSNCMVSLARFFLGFTTEESCGKCTPCRVGTKVLLDILEDITEGRGKEGDIETLQDLGKDIIDTSLCGLGQTAPNPVLTTIKYFRHEYEAHIKHKRCDAMVCKELVSSACQHTCPIGTEVPLYISLIAQKRFDEAFHVIRKDNPLANVCGRVCHHPCESRCKAAEAGQPLAVRTLKRFALDHGNRKGLKLPLKVKEPKNKKVAVIGSGPSGLSAGYSLALEGYDITIFEGKSVIGGMLRVALPLYRLPREQLDSDIEAIKDSGVKFRTNTSLGKDISVDSLFSDGYEAVYISVGAHRPMNLGIPNEDCEGVIPSLQFLEAVNLGKEIRVGKRVGIIGGGNAAVDAARAAHRMPGTEKVTLIYRRTREEMPAYKEEVDAVIEEGIDLQFLTAPTQVLTRDGKLSGIEVIRMELGEVDASGRRRPIPVKGSEFTIELDTLIRAIGETPDPGFLKDQGLDLSKRNTILVDPDAPHYLNHHS